MSAISSTRGVSFSPADAIAEREARQQKAAVAEKKQHEREQRKLIREAHADAVAREQIERCYRQYTPPQNREV